MRDVVVLGASGSIGQQSLDLLRWSQSEFALTALSVGQNVDVLPNTIAAFPGLKMIWVLHEKDRALLAKRYENIVWLTGKDGMDKLLDDSKQALVVNAISGFAGLRATLQSLKSMHRTLLLANKESLVVAGKLVHDLQARTSSKIIPIDSEHSAIWQCLETNQRINRVLLTASGGPFRDLSLAELQHVNKAQALAHPNWKMGASISIDSATMMNKSYEMLEAYHLFDCERIEVLIHPQSVIHSMVEYDDYTIKAVMSKPDMKQVIWYALNFPKRTENQSLSPMDFRQGINLTLTTIDENRFTAIKMARYCLKNINSNSLTIGLNAINECVRQAFLEGVIKFADIVPLIERHFYKLEKYNFTTYQAICAYDDKIRASISIEGDRFDATQV